MKMYFMAAILNFQFLAGRNRQTSWFLAVLNSALFKVQCYKCSCFYPDVHTQGTFCYISAPLPQKSLAFVKNISPVASASEWNEYLNQCKRIILLHRLSIFSITFTQTSVCHAINMFKYSFPPFL